jgi:hypothetical protein
MRCKACDTLLNDYESARKYPGTKEFIDLCGPCYTESWEAHRQAMIENQMDRDEAALRALENVQK